MIEFLGMIAAVILSFFNIPLILRIRRRKSSNDISLIWLFGIFSCVLMLLPAAIVSEDLTFKIFGITNAFFFSGVVFYVLRYREKKSRKEK